jgi:hypothetical protein
MSGKAARGGDSVGVWPERQNRVFRAKLAQPDEVVAACRSRVEVIAFAVGDVPGEADEGR